LSRPHSHFSEDEHVIAANVDQIIIVVSFVEPELKTGLIDRYSVVAELNQLPLIICFNKTDLIDINNYLEIIDTYKKIGYKTILCSIIKNDGIEDLKKIISNKTSVFSGHSGVGKSSLINLMDATIDLKTSSVSSFSKKGTHTTSSAELFLLGAGKIIDTPGIKEFGLWGFEKESLSQYFKEFKEFSKTCKFYNCSHVHEPKCSVKTAHEDGLVSSFRYKNYLSMIDELSENKNY
jgi:ribosome biogenesis GTPase / thiamine phosphate phosphatase